MQFLLKYNLFFFKNIQIQNKSICFYYFALATKGNCLPKDPIFTVNFVLSRWAAFDI